MMRTGIVLEGGAMRGMFTAGVLDVFMENGITFDGAVGVSAGAVFGCNLKSHQIGRGIRYNKKYCRDRRYVSFIDWIKTGDLYNPEFDYDVLPNKLDIFDRETYQKDSMDFYIVATDIVTGKPVYQLCNKGDEYDIQWMRASASMPLFSNPVKIEGKPSYGGEDASGLYLDGGTSDSVPLKFFESIGYDKIVVVTTRPKGYRKKQYPCMWWIKKKLAEYPKLAETMENRHIMYNDTMEYIDEKETSDNNIFVIRPKEGFKAKSIERNPDKLERVYQNGRAVSEEVLGKLKEFLLAE